MNYAILNTAKKIIIYLFVMGGSFFSYTTMAACSIAGIITQPSTFHSATELKIDSSVAIGEELGIFRFQTTFLAGSAEITCTEEKPTITITSTFPIESPGIFQTRIPGVGMKITSTAIGGPLPFTYTSATNTSVIDHYFIYIITFIKTGYIASGGQLPAGLIAHGYLENPGNLPVYDGILTVPVTLELLRPTCTVNIPNFTVNLGEVSLSSFNTLGRTTPTNFNIDLTCGGGTNSADVHVTLTDTNNPANATSQLDLSPDSTAQGIALEVNNRFGLVRFGPDLEGVGNPGQWNDGATGEGSYSIPLSVNYVRLPGPIKGGTANSGVTYTLNYD